MISLEGKHILVTGAGQGIGEVIAQTAHGLGATVWVADINADHVATVVARLGSHAHALTLDVSSTESWAAAREAVARQTDSLHGLVHNAGIGVCKPLADHAFEDWRAVMAVNLDGPFVGTKTFLPMLEKAFASTGSWASVVCISSAVGLVGIPDQISYNVSKAGLRHLAKSLAVEFGHHGQKIRINSVHPGAIDTPILSMAVQAWAASGIIAEPTVEAAKGLHAMNEVGSAADIANGTAYLLSDAAGFVTGTELVIDGGWTAR